MASVAGHDEWMPLQLSDRSTLVSPLPLCTVAEARMLGVNLRDRKWIRLRKGVYANRADFDALRPWTRYAARVHAFLRMHPDAVLCLESGAVIHGIPHFGETKDIHVFDRDRSSSTRYGDVVVHTSTDARTIDVISGTYVTSLADTVSDLVRLVPPAHGLAIADAAISPTQGGQLTLEHLRSRAVTQDNQRGRARLHWVCDNADGRSESVGESVSRAVIEWCGFERPVLQERFFYEGFRDRGDFYFASCGVIGESDGWGKYELDDPAEAQKRLRDEKRREDRLRRHGHPIARWELRDAQRVDPLVKILLSTGIPRVAPEDPLMLATLRENRRAKSSRENRPAA